MSEHSVSLGENALLRAKKRAGDRARCLRGPGVQAMKKDRLRQAPPKPFTLRLPRSLRDELEARATRPLAHVIYEACQLWLALETSGGREILASLDLSEAEAVLVRDALHPVASKGWTPAEARAYVPLAIEDALWASRRLEAHGSLLARTRRWTPAQAFWVARDARRD